MREATHHCRIIHSAMRVINSAMRFIVRGDVAATMPAVSVLSSVIGLFSCAVPV